MKSYKLTKPVGVLFQTLIMTCGLVRRSRRLGRAPPQENCGTRGRPRNAETWKRSFQCAEYNNGNKKKHFGMERSRSPHGELADKYQHDLLSCQINLRKLFTYGNFSISLAVFPMHSSCLIVVVTEP